MGGVEASMGTEPPLQTPNAVAHLALLKAAARTLVGFSPRTLPWERSLLRCFIAETIYLAVIGTSCFLASYTLFVQYGKVQLPMGYPLWDSARGWGHTTDEHR